MTGFVKVEGLGNDFVLFDGRRQPVPLDPSRVIALCDRHRGVGADGVLLIERSERALARLVIWNADGSQAEMCGNGLRCVAQALLREGGAREITVETGAGVHRCRMGEATEVWVELVGITVSAPETIELSSGLLKGRRVQLGNPHFVVFGAGGADRAESDGRNVERHPAFAPRGTNVEFCEVIGDCGVKVDVWERGAGLTLACGTGAAAAVAAAWADNLVPRAPTVAQLPGGPLRIEPLTATTVGLSGPARTIFHGQWSL